MHVNGNIYYFGAQPYIKEVDYVQRDNFNPNVRIEDTGKNSYLHIIMDSSMKSISAPMVKGELVDETIITRQDFTSSGESCLKIDLDYFGRSRDSDNPTPGPFETIETDKIFRLKLW